MAIVDLTALPCREGDVALLDWAVLQEPALGGVTQRVARLGSRFSFDFQTPKMKLEGDGRRAIALLQLAQRLGGRVAYPQPDFHVGAVGAPLVNGIHTGGTTLALKGLTPNYAVHQGQALSLTVAGRSYLYFAAANAIMDGAGAGSVTLTIPMRTHLAGNEVAELARPVIEGWLAGTERSWTIETARTTGLQFKITERA
jgi:hypothetical protein